MPSSPELLPQGSPDSPEVSPQGSPDSPEVPPDSPEVLPEVPPEERPLDPRAIARASLAAGRNASLWVVAGAVAALVVITLTVGGTAGASGLALLLAVCAIARVLWPGRGPVALAVRSRGVDVAVLAVLAIGLGVLSQTIPD